MPLEGFFSPAAGQKRRKWLDEKMAAPAGLLNYFLGPTGIPGKMQAVGQGLEYTDAGDMVAAADASRDLWNNPTLGNTGRYLSAGAALAVPFVGNKLAQNIADPVGDAISSGVDDAWRLWIDESGALGGKTDGIKAYHGSPHDFDRFSMDKIGTGEGAQAYGHGLYFAESEDVARSYRDALARGDSSDPVYNAYDLIKSGLPKEEARALFQEIVEEGAKTWPTDRRPQMLDFAKKSVEAIDSGAVDRYVPPGRMYEVNINANPDDFLDWDAPLSEQPKSVQEIARTMDLSGLTSRQRGKIQKWRDGTANELEMPTGNELHSALTDFGTDSNRNAGLTQRLSGQGIPGIKYRDAVSRGSEGGTRNYVVFDDNLVSIIRKYGIAGAAAMLGMSAQDLQAQADQQEVSEYLKSVGAS